MKDFFIVYERNNWEIIFFIPLQISNTSLVFLIKAYRYKKRGNIIHSFLYFTPLFLHKPNPSNEMSSINFSIARYVKPIRPYSTQNSYNITTSSSSMKFPMKVLKSKLNDVYHPIDCQSTSLVFAFHFWSVWHVPKSHRSIDWLVNKCLIVQTNLMYCSISQSQGSLFQLRVPSIPIEIDRVLSTSVCRMTSCQIWCFVGTTNDDTKGPNDNVKIENTQRRRTVYGSFFNFHVRVH